MIRYVLGKQPKAKITKKRGKDMRFPNAYKGIKKIWIAELLLLVAAVLGIAALIIVANNVDVTTEVAAVGDSVVVGETVFANEGAIAPAAILTLCTGLLALIAFILNLVGIIGARKDDENFKLALYVTLIGIAASIVTSIWSNNEMLKRWMDVVNTICSLFASYFVLTGIASLADQFPDAETKTIALKSRTWLEGAFCLSAVLKFIVNLFNIQNATVVLIMSVAALVVEIISYVLYLRALNKGKNMLAK